MTRLITLIPALALIGLTAACYPATPPPVDAYIVQVEGDSITWQYMTHGGDLPAHITTNAGPGWTVSECGIPAPCTPPDVDAGSTPADAVVFMLGTNDADPVWQGGWTADDEAAWASALAAPECAVVVLPWIGPGASPAHQAEVDKARAWLAANAPRTVDWRDYVTDKVLDPDDVHLAYQETTLTAALASVGGDPLLVPHLGLPLAPEALQARRAVITDAADACAPA